jgi:hypothetical protein
MKAKQLFETLTDLFPFRRKRSFDWIVPASVGLGLGVAAGVGLGMLIAPSSGEMTRQKLRDRAERMKDRARLAAERTRGRISERVVESPATPPYGANEVGGVR